MTANMHEYATTCPYCGAIQYLHSGTTTDTAPKDGDVSICWSCTNPSIYTVTAVGVARRRLTADEASELAANEHVRAARAAIAESYRPSEAVALARGEAPDA